MITVNRQNYTTYVSLPSQNRETNVMMLKIQIVTGNNNGICSVSLNCWFPLNLVEPCQFARVIEIVDLPHLRALFQSHVPVIFILFN